MKQYMLSVCYPAGGTQPPPDALQRIMRDVHVVQKEMQAAGVWIFSGGLTPPDSATVLRHQGGEVVTTDGPFIESKEQIGGITILEGTRSRRGAGVGPQARARHRHSDRSAPVRGGALSAQIETIFRREHGRAVAVLVRFLGDIGLAEEAVQDAFTIALTTLAT